MHADAGVKSDRGDHCRRSGDTFNAAGKPVLLSQMMQEMLCHPLLRHPTA